ncbi:rho GTPase-activating protein 22 isoform X24 [Macaca nemestrina]|uniref:rho GTPase-activating protein 22 isoform X24 n=1 Tax=Macaca nemestrina TaxID=9545 RepID=UPI0039B98E83
MLPTASSKRRTFAARYFTRSKSLVMGEQSRSPGRTPCPHRLGPVLKAGWLKKQRSIMKNWQQRWFVLRGDQLFYYKDKDEIKPQGSLGSAWRTQSTTSGSMAPAWRPYWWSSVWTSSGSAGSLRRGCSACRARPTW